MGTAAPDSKLTISGSGTQNLRIISTDYNDAGVILQRGTYGTDAYSDWFIYDSGGTLKLDSYQSSSQNTRMTILTTGEVGIGDTTPSYMLSVDGTASISGGLYLSDVYYNTLIGPADV